MAIHHSQLLIYTKLIFKKSLRIEVHTSLYFSIVSIQMYLISYFFRILPAFATNPVNTLTDVNMFAITVFAPPIQQHRVVGYFKSDVPI